MFTPIEIIAFEWGVVENYGVGTMQIVPPFAWAGAFAGGWLNRSHANGPRLGGTLLGGTIGAWLGFWWVWAGNRSDTLQDHLFMFISGLLKPYFEIGQFGFDGLTAAGLYHLPMLLASALYLLARQHEEALDEWMSRLRQRVSERRHARAGHAATAEIELPPVRLEAVAEMPPVPAVAEPAAVVKATAGEPFAFSGGHPSAGAPSAGPIVIHVQSPTAHRGRVSGFFFGFYYACAVVTKLWLPLTLLGLWLFWTPLVNYVEERTIEAVRHALHL